VAVFFSGAEALMPALDLVRQVASHLKTYRAERAKLALSHYLRLTPRNGRYSPDVAASRREFELRLLAIKG
jgi:hypothetical protein